MLDDPMVRMYMRYTVDWEIFVVKKCRGCLKPRKVYTRNLLHNQ